MVDTFKQLKDATDKRGGPEKGFVINPIGMME